MQAPPVQTGHTNDESIHSNRMTSYLFAHPSEQGVTVFIPSDEKDEDGDTTHQVIEFVWDMDHMLSVDPLFSTDLDEFQPVFCLDLNDAAQAAMKAIEEDNAWHDAACMSCWQGLDYCFLSKNED